jgi:hypothetical protein
MEPKLFGRSVRRFGGKIVQVSIPEKRFYSSLTKANSKMRVFGPGEVFCSGMSGNQLPVSASWWQHGFQQCFATFI